MKVIAIIPARYASTRLHGKVLLPINGKPLIYHVYKNVADTVQINDTIVATDSDIVIKECEKLKIKSMLTSSEHKSGTSRIIEIAKKVEADIIINVQGDEPLIYSEILSSLIKTFEDETVNIATIKTLIKDSAMIKDENAVKVVCDKNDFALYFSRATIPHKRSDIDINVDYYKHIGVYAYRRDTLLEIENMKASEYENIEMLEQLRWLYNGLRIKVIKADKDLHGVDTKEDLEYISKHHFHEGA